MILYINYATFSKWSIDLRKEIKLKMIASGSKISMDDYFPIQSRMTRKHIGFEFSTSENGTEYYHNALNKFSSKPTAVVKESVIKLKILNRKKFTNFMFKYNKDFDFIDKDKVMM
jgi:hypothetical protein